MNSYRDPSGILAFGAHGSTLPPMVFAACLALFGLALIGESHADTSASHCDTIYDEDASYPPLPALQQADVSGEAGIIFYLQHHRGVVDLDGCFYELDRPLEIDFDGLEQIELLFELPEANTAEVYVDAAGVPIEALDIYRGQFSYTLTPDASLGFEIAADGQASPTSPVIIAESIPPNPPPQ